MSAVVAAGTALGVVADRVRQNEFDSKKFWFDPEMLRQTAKERTGRKQIGFYPDFDAGESTAWRQVDEYYGEIGRVDLLGFFGVIEDFDNPERVAHITHLLERIRSRGARPVWSLGTGGWNWRSHPFLLQNREFLLKRVQMALQLLENVQIPTTLRLFYEANANFFIYGTQREMSDAQHSQAYSEIFSWVRHYIDQRPSLDVELMSSPYVRSNVRHYTTRQAGGMSAHGVGVDGYGMYPGRGNWNHPHYWYPGYIPPEAVLYQPLHDLQVASGSQGSLNIWELGTISRDPAWLKQAATLLYAMGGESVMYFDYDKSYQRIPYEANWRMTPEIKTMFRDLCADLLPSASVTR